MDHEVLSQINKKLEKLVTIETSIKNVESRFSNFERNMKKEVEKLHTKITSTEYRIAEIKSTRNDDAEAYRKAFEVVLEGLPGKFKKSLFDIYDLLCTALGYDKDGLSFSNTEKTFAVRSYYPEVKLFLLKRKGGKESAMIIRFASIFEKDFFINQYYQKAKSVTSAKLGFKDSIKIFLHHNLTQKRYKLFKDAIGKKKEGLLKSVNVSSYGIISVKTNGSSKFQVIEDAAMLEKICAEADKVTGETNGDSSEQEDEEEEDSKAAE